MHFDTKSLKIFLYSEFCRNNNKRWSDGATSGEYGGRCKGSQQICSSTQRDMWSGVVLLEHYPVPFDNIRQQFDVFMFHVRQLTTVHIRVNDMVLQEKHIINNAFMIPPCTKHSFLGRNIRLWLMFWGIEIYQITFSYAIHFSFPVTNCWQKRHVFIPFHKHTTNKIPIQTINFWEFPKDTSIISRNVS